MASLWGVDTTGFDQMFWNNPFMRSAARQRQEEEEEPVGFMNKFAAGMPGYNLPGMSNDMKRQALNEALLAAGAAMMQNAGSGNIGLALSDAIQKGLGSYKEGLSTQYTGLEEQRKREDKEKDEWFKMAQEGRLSEQARIQAAQEARAAEEWGMDKSVKERTGQEVLEKFDRDDAARAVTLPEAFEGMNAQEKVLYEVFQQRGEPDKALDVLKSVSDRLRDERIAGMRAEGYQSRGEDANWRKLLDLGAKAAGEKAKQASAYQTEKLKIVKEYASKPNWQNDPKQQLAMQTRLLELPGMFGFADESEVGEALNSFQQFASAYGSLEPGATGSGIVLGPPGTARPDPLGDPSGIEELSRQFDEWVKGYKANPTDEWLMKNVPPDYRSFVKQGAGRR